MSDVYFKNRKNPPPDLERAKSEIKIARNLKPDDLAIKMVEFQILKQKGDKAEAIEVADEIIEENPALKSNPDFKGYSDKFMEFNLKKIQEDGDYEDDE